MDTNLAHILGTLGFFLLLGIPTIIVYWILNRKQRRG